MGSANPRQYYNIRKKGYKNEWKSRKTMQNPREIENSGEHAVQIKSIYI